MMFSGTKRYVSRINNTLRARPPTLSRAVFTLVILLSANLLICDTVNTRINKPIETLEKDYNDRTGESLFSTEFHHVVNEKTTFRSPSINIPDKTQWPPTKHLSTERTVHFDRSLEENGEELVTSKEENSTEAASIVSDFETVPDVNSSSCPSLIGFLVEELTGSDSGMLNVSWSQPEIAVKGSVCISIVAMDNIDCTKGEVCDTDLSAGSQIFPFECPFEYYNISAYVQCDGNKGDLVFFVIRTNPVAPSEPENFEAVDVTATSVELTWSPPTNPNGPLDGYLLRWTHKPDFEDEAKLTSTSISLSSLKPWTEYTFSLSAFNDLEDQQMLSPSVETNITTLPEKPSEPQNFSVVDVSATSARLIWLSPMEPNGPIDGYILNWGKTDSNLLKMNSLILPPSVSYSVDSLQPWTSYDFYLRAFNEYEDEKLIGLPWKVSALTGEGVAGPPEVTRFSAGNTSFLVEWTEPAQPNGEIKGYKLFWYKALTEEENVVDVTGVNRWNVSGLEPYTSYSFEIAAVNGAGIGEKSKRQQVTTDVGAPGAPEPFRVKNLNSTAVKLMWEPPTDPRGPIDGYTCSWRRKSGPRQNETSLALPKDAKSLTVSNLQPWTEYIVAVAAYNLDRQRSVIAGSLSILSHRTMEDVPSEPIHFRVFEKTSSTVLLKWEKPLRPNGRLVNYTVEWAPQSTSGVSHFTNTTSNQLQLKHLDPYTEYVTAVSAWTSIGQGPWSLKRYPKTDASVPEIPTINHLEVRSSTSIYIEWLKSRIYPGPTNYTVEVWENPFPCANKPDFFVRNITNGLADWNNNTITVTDLKPYTFYFFRVTASTKAGSSFSNFSKPELSSPDVPGPPSLMEADCTSSSTSVQLTWGSPKSPNGPIEGYLVSYNSKRDIRPKSRFIATKVGSLCEIVKNTITLKNLHPETNYKFTIKAKVLGLEDYGEELRYDRRCVLPAGIPPFPDNYSVPKVCSSTEHEVDIVWSKEMFSTNMGSIIQYSVIVASPKKIAGLPHNGTLEDVKNFPCWAEYWKQVSEIYQATPEAWNPFQDGVYDPLNCYKFIESGKELLHCTLGWEKNCSENTEDYCNGPLKAGKSYGIKLRGFTKGGYSETYPVYTKTIPPKDEAHLGAILGSLFTILVLLILAAGMAFLYKKRKDIMVFNHIMVLFRNSAEPDSEPVTKIICETNGNINDHKTSNKPLDLASFLDHVKDMMSDSFLKFSAEFEELKKNSPKYPCTAAEMEENHQKNRWINIFPFDHSRVKLLPVADEPGSDYINASYIPGFSSHREYIASQGPLPNTVDDFWRVIWEQGVTMIVMLTQCVERGKVKCEKYWPSDSESACYGDLKVKLVSESALSVYSIRSFTLQLGERQRSIKQMHFTKWPDFGCPESPEVLINFVRAVRDHLPQTNPGPILVHCSAGVGRTGTFIVVDLLLQHIQDYNTVDVFGTVMNLRKHRTNMVQTEDQYIYIHMCLKELILEKLSERNSDVDCDGVIYSNVQCKLDPDV